MSDDVETPIHGTVAGLGPVRRPAFRPRPALRRRRRDPGAAATEPAMAVGAVLDEPEIAAVPDTSGPNLPPEPPSNGGGGGSGGSGRGGRPGRPRLRKLRLLAIF